MEVPYFDGHLVNHAFHAEKVADEKTCIYRRISARSRPAVAHQRQERPARGRRIRHVPIGFCWCRYVAFPAFDQASVRTAIVNSRRSSTNAA